MNQGRSTPRSPWQTASSSVFCVYAVTDYTVHVPGLKMYSLSNQLHHMHEMLLDNLYSRTQRTEITAKNENQQLVSKTYVARSDYMQYVLVASNKYKYNKIYTVTVPKQLLCIIHNTIFHNHRISLCTQATSTVMVKPG